MSLIDYMNEEVYNPSRRDCDKEEWAYIAGFLDGEGCLSFHKERTGHFTPFLTLTNWEDIIRIQERITEGGKFVGI